MKKVEKILLLTVFLCLLPIADLFALSQEAQEAIEAIRARLKAAEKSSCRFHKYNSSDEYIPGKELAEALARFRRQQNRQNNLENICSQIKEETQERELKDQGFQGKIVEAKKAEDSLTEQDEILEDTEAVVVKKEPAYVPGRLLFGSLMRIRHSQRRETPASQELAAAIEAYERRISQRMHEKEKAESGADSSFQAMQRASEEIEELFNDPEKRSRVAEAKRREIAAQKAFESDDPENKNKIDDKKFNDYISRYDFKMPENYRILLD